ncbi:hypothetical protein K0M31_011517 [Melipona bicolor]|uniref:BTB domain-containing protein n=1 Tax=Melipona bicolor TaxID=60889 RepID=A0AA40G9P3_9HYME|nr:hypothetical protein K0M31_011517 [Melipona bicolor]
MNSRVIVCRRSCQKPRHQHRGLKRTEDSSKSFGTPRRSSDCCRCLASCRRVETKLLAEPDEDRSESPRPGNSKSSVVVLYREKSVAPAASIPEPPPPLRAAQSEQAVTRQRSPPSSRRQRSDLLDTPHRLPVYPVDRRKAALRRRRRLSKRRTPVNAHVYQEQARSLSEDRRAGSKKVQLPERRSDLARYTTESAKNLIRSRGGSSTRQDDDSDDPDRDRRSNNQWRRDRTFEERCRPSDNSVSKLMARSSPGKDGDCKQRRNKACPNLTYLTHTRSREQGDVHRAFVSLNDGGNAKRVFPFQQTPSGNLKIIPNQVVFESNKVSVLVADPRHAKVNVKAELNRAGNELGGRVSESATRPRPIDLPLRVSSSTIDQLQSQKNLPSTEDDYRPTIHPFKGKFSQVETMEHKQQSTSSATHEIPVLQEVPLSTLGFTSEQPIDWDNVILPEKTDLYQELARRITNYKNADCIVRIDHDEFHCHLLVLQSYSSFFDEKNCKEIDLTEKLGGHASESPPQLPRTPEHVINLRLITRRVKRVVTTGRETFLRAIDILNATVSFYDCNAIALNTLHREFIIRQRRETIPPLLERKEKKERNRNSTTPHYTRSRTGREIYYGFIGIQNSLANPE